MPRWLGINEVASYFNVDYQTVWRWIKTGKLPAIKTPGGQWRVPRANLDPAILRTDRAK